MRQPFYILIAMAKEMLLIKLKMKIFKPFKRDIIKVYLRDLLVQNFTLSFFKT